MYDIVIGGGLFFYIIIGYINYVIKCGLVFMRVMKLDELVVIRNKLGRNKGMFVVREL